MKNKEFTVGDWIFAALCVCWLFLQFATRYLWHINPLFQRYIYLLFSFAVVFFPIAGGKGAGTGKTLVNWLSLIAAAAIGIYLAVSSERYIERWQFVDDVELGDIVVTLAFLLLLLEGTRRTAGNALSIFTLVMIAYGFFGKYIPGFFGHRGITLADMAEIQTMSTIGVFGIAAGVCVEYVFYFVIFGAIYDSVGGGDLLTKLGIFFTRRQVGGTAKSAVFASALMGSVSGSAVANVTSTGAFTIPLMIRSGISPTVAGAIEAAASTGGQFMPPIMGAGAFVLADTLGIKYLEVVKAAVLPAICYYVAVYWYVHYYSKKIGLQPLEVPVTRGEIMQKAHLLIPLASLMYFIIAGNTVSYAVMKSLVILLVVAFAFPSTRISPKDFLRSIVKSMQQCASVGLPIFITGVTIGVAIQTGIALKSTGLIVGVGKGTVLLALIIGALVCIVLGMGLPTVAAYVVASMFVVPPLVKQGIPALPLHMFVFFYSILAQITPPVAVTAYAGAGIAGSPPVATAFQAFKISLVAFLIPYTFVYNHGILLEGSWPQIASALATTLGGCFCLAIALSGYTKRKMPARSLFAYRIIMFVASVLFISPSDMAGLVGAMIAAACLLYDRAGAAGVAERQAT